jgi:hypothetical protein
VVNGTERLNSTFNETLDGALNSTLNNTLNETLGRAAENISVLKDIVPLVLSRFWDLIAAPFHRPEMLWIIMPLLFTFIVMEFYFGRHRDEELGWAAAVANSLILIIVAIDLLKHSFHYAPPWTVFKEIMTAAFTDAVLPLPPQVVLLILFLGASGVAITFINYFHLLPSRIAFEVSGHPPVNFLAYFAIAIVYSAGTRSEIPFDIATLIAGALLYVLMLIIIFMVRKATGNVRGGFGRF